MKILLLGIVFLIPCFVIAQNLSNTQIDSLIADIKTAVTENYILPQKAKFVCDSLHASDYYNLPAVDSLMKKLNEDFNTITQDKHLFIQYRPEVAENLMEHKDIHKDQNKKEKKEEYGFEKPKILEGNIGYLKLNYFADAEHAKRSVLKKIHFFKNTTALILDLRNNLGGSGSMLQLLSGIFLPADQHEILKINYTTGDEVTITATTIKPDQQYLKQPVYILCNSQTFSAGEAFAFIMKNRGRATLVGETTAGAGNVAGPYPVYHNFVLTIPVGIIVDPMTNTGWEHVGVKPDVITDPDLALEKAIEISQNKI